MASAASALCPATSLLALASDSVDVFEIGHDILSPGLRDEGLLCETVTAALGYDVDNYRLDLLIRLAHISDPLG